MLLEGALANQWFLVDYDLRGVILIFTSGWLMFVMASLYLLRDEAEPTAAKCWCHKRT